MTVKVKQATQRAIGYTRVSTQAQGADGLGMDVQRRQIIEACEKRGWELVGIRHDVASGKSTDGREGFAKALDALQRGHADTLIVAKLDRLARSTVDFARTVERAEKEGWRLVILDPEIDLATPFGRAMAGVVSVFAQLERDMISDRISAAMQEKKARGERVGMPVHLHIPPGAMRLIVAGREREGLSWRGVARKLDESPWDPPRGRSRTWHPYTAQQAYLRHLAGEAGS